MIQGLDLRYTITTNAATTVLAYAPEKWDEGLVKWIRSEKYWGLLRSFSIPLKFYKDGRDILLAVYAAEGSEGRAEVLIERLDRTTGSYVTYYKGVVDFAQCRVTSTYFECNVVEGGISQMIKLQGDTKYNLTANPYYTALESQEIRFAHNGAYKFNAYTIRSAFEALLYQMNGASVPFYSPLLDDMDASNDLMFITNGRAIRTDDHEANSLSISLNDLFNLLNERFCVGLGVEVIAGDDTVVLDGREYFLQDAEITEVNTNTMEFEITHAKQFVGNRLKYGWNTWIPEEQSASPVTDRFAKIVEATMPIKTMKELIDISSEFFVDGKYFHHMYDIGGLASDDVAGDNDLFAMHVKYDDSQYYFWDGRVNGTAGNLNTWLSPKRSLLRWKKYLESVTAGIVEVTNTPYIVPTLPYGWTGIYVYSDKDTTNVYEDTSLVLDGTEFMFKPYLFKIKCSGTVDISDLLDSNHNGYISFIYRGVTLKGHIMEVSANPTRRRELEMTLLAHKDTDLSDIL